MALGSVLARGVARAAVLRLGLTLSATCRLLILIIDFRQILDLFFFAPSAFFLGLLLLFFDSGLKVPHRFFISALQWIVPVGRIGFLHCRQQVVPMCLSQLSFFRRGVASVLLEDAEALSVFAATLYIHPHAAGVCIDALGLITAYTTPAFRPLIGHAVANVIACFLFLLVGEFFASK